ncbi:MAG: adenosylcobinamide-GDP ribazoletransferase [Chloroflexota bacterium]
MGLRYQGQLLLTAFLFYTRLPVAQWVEYSEDKVSQSLRYLPLVGLIVGGLGAIAFWLAHQLWSQEIALVLSMATTILVTGAFHEDGLADAADGFFGGWTAEQVLRIMKDSRVGTFGVLALGLTVGLKFFTLASLSATQIPWVLIAGHSVSRLMAIIVMAQYPYVRQDADSKVKLATKPVPVADLFISAVYALIPLFFLPLLVWLALLPVGLLTYFCGRYFAKRLGGYTGDCLGATQQLTEVAFYLGVGLG